MISGGPVSAWSMTAWRRPPTEGAIQSSIKVRAAIRAKVTHRPAVATTLKRKPL